jgi:hypothetical protein
MSVDQQSTDSSNETPAPIAGTIRNKKNDSWYEYDGEPLFEGEMLSLICNKLDQMESMEWGVIAGIKGSSWDRTKIHTDMADEFLEAFESRFEEVDNEYTFILSKNNPEITEKGPIRSDVSVHYEVGRHAGLGGAKYKRQKILYKIRDFENYLYKTEVVDPVFKEYNEKYPY